MESGLSILALGQAIGRIALVDCNTPVSVPQVTSQKQQAQSELYIGSTLHLSNAI